AVSTRDKKKSLCAYLERRGSNRLGSIMPYAGSDHDAVCGLKRLSPPLLQDLFEHFDVMQGIQDIPATRLHDRSSQPVGYRRICQQLTLVALCHRQSPN